MSILKKKYGHEACPCKQSHCTDRHLTGIGKFVQGSGFKKEEADLICNLLNESDMIKKNAIGKIWRPIKEAPDGEFVVLKINSGYLSYPHRVVVARYDRDRSLWFNVGGDSVREDGEVNRDAVWCYPEDIGL